MSKLWDDMLKRLFAANPQHFLNWLLPGAVVLRELSTELKTQTLAELKSKQPLETRDLYTDILYVILWYGVETILHLEFQRRGDKEMGKRLWHYNSTISINRDMPVCSIVIYLRDDRVVEKSPYTDRLADGRPNHIFFYEVVKLWEVKARFFLQPEAETLLPLVTLTADGKREEIVEEMIARLAAKRNNNLLSMAFNFAALVYTQPEEQHWLLERFEMFEDELEESWVYQHIMGKGLTKGLEKGREEGLEKGLEKGQRETLRETFLGFLNARYPMLVDLAGEQISDISDIKQLQEIINRVFYLQTAGEIEEYLLSLHSDDARN